MSRSGNGRLTAESLVAAATSCYRASRLHPIQPRGPHSLFRTGFSVKRPLPLRTHRFVSTLLRRGARNLLRFRLPCQPTSSTLLFRPSGFRLSERGGGFYHRRVGCQLRSLTSYFVFHFFSAAASVASATSLFRPRVESTTRFCRLIPLAVGFFSRTGEAPRIYDRLRDLSTSSTRPFGFRPPPPAPYCRGDAGLRSYQCWKEQASLRWSVTGVTPRREVRRLIHQLIRRRKLFHLRLPVRPTRTPGL